MNILTNIIFIFIFIFISIIIGVPGIVHNNIIQNKIYLFGGVFIFQLLFKSIYKLRYKCKNIDIKTIINEALMMGILCVIGYSLYIDLLIMENTKQYILNFQGSDNSHTYAFLISIIISLFVLISKIIEIIITGKKDECIISD